MALLSINKTYKDGDILFALDLDNICDSVEGFLNQPGLDETNIQTSLTSGLLFPGMIMLYGSDTAPTGWLSCDGSAVSQSTYAALFNIIGTTYGNPGGGNFNLPDFRRRAAMGPGGTQIYGPGITIASSGGEESHTLTVPEFPSHLHDDSPGHQHQQTVRGSTLAGGASNIGSNFNRSANPFVQTTTPTGSASVPNIGSTGGDGAHNNIQPSLVSNFIIKV